MVDEIWKKLVPSVNHGTMSTFPPTSSFSFNKLPETPNGIYGEFSEDSKLIEWQRATNVGNTFFFFPPNEGHFTYLSEMSVS